MQSQNDRHGRNCLLTSYIHYQAHLPHPDFRNATRTASSATKPAGISLLADDEVGNIIMKGQNPALDRIANGKEYLNPFSSVMTLRIASFVTYPVNIYLVKLEVDSKFPPP